jgi:hypothetical protein
MESFQNGPESSEGIRQEEILKDFQNAAIDREP